MAAPLSPRLTANHVLFPDVQQVLFSQESSQQELADALVKSCEKVWSQPAQTAVNSVKSLLEKGADPNRRSSNGQTSLTVICHQIEGQMDEDREEMKVLQLLLQQKTIDVNFCSTGDISPLDQLFSKNPINCLAVKLLLEKGANLDKKGLKEPYLKIAKKQKNKELIKLLTELQKAKPALKQGQDRRVSFLVKDGIDRQPLVLQQSKTALFSVETGRLSRTETKTLYASCDEKPDFDYVTRALSRIDAQTDDGLEILFYALLRACNTANSEDHVKIVDELLKKGADPNRRDPGGNVPLLSLCKLITTNDPYEEVHLKILQALVDKGAHVNIKERGTGFTALQCTFNHKAVEILLLKGANPNLYGGLESPLGVAESKLDKAKLQGRANSVETLERTVELLRNPSSCFMQKIDPVGDKPSSIACNTPEMLLDLDQTPSSPMLMVKCDLQGGQRLRIRGNGEGMYNWGPNGIHFFPITEDMWGLDLSKYGDSFEYKFYLEGPAEGMGEWEIIKGNRQIIEEQPLIEPFFNQKAEMTTCTLSTEKRANNGWPSHVDDPLYQACRLGDAQSIESLIGNINKTAKNPKSILSNALVEVCNFAKNEGHLAIARRLLKEGVHINFRDRNGNGALHFLCHKITIEDPKDSICLQILKEFINHHADPNLRHGFWEDVPLELTFNSDALKMLLDAGADPYQSRRIDLPWDETKAWLDTNTFMGKRWTDALKQTMGVWQEYLAQFQPNETRIVVKSQLKPGKTLFLRASPEELGNWKKGFAMTQIGSDLWEWRSTVPTASFEFKVLSDNQDWQEGDNLQMVANKTARFFAQFPGNPNEKVVLPHSRLTVVYSPKAGQRLEIRGNGPGMNEWKENAINVRQLDEKTWAADLYGRGQSSGCETFEYKFCLKEPGQATPKWEVGENHEMQPGDKIALHPQFV